jgi:hypothetical protein
MQKEGATTSLSCVIYVNIVHKTKRSSSYHSASYSTSKFRVSNLRPVFLTKDSCFSPIHPYECWDSNLIQDAIGLPRPLYFINYSRHLIRHYSYVVEVKALLNIPKTNISHANNHMKFVPI